MDQQISGPPKIIDSIVTEPLKLINKTAIPTKIKNITVVKAD